MFLISLKEFQKIKTVQPVYRRRVKQSIYDVAASKTNTPKVTTIDDKREQNIQKRYVIFKERQLQQIEQNKLNKQIEQDEINKTMKIKRQQNEQTFQNFVFRKSNYEQQNKLLNSSNLSLEDSTIQKINQKNKGYYILDNQKMIKIYQESHDKFMEEEQQKIKKEQQNQRLNNKRLQIQYQRKNEEMQQRQKYIQKLIEK